jgi:hypothetical protein
MIVPTTPGMTTPGAPAQPMPSETNLLMALAEMHKQGRFNPKETPDVRKPSLRLVSSS